MAALEEQVEAYLGQPCYEHCTPTRMKQQGHRPWPTVPRWKHAVRRERAGAGGYVRCFRRNRNGYSRRRLVLGCGTIELKESRVRDIPPGQPPFESKIIRRYQRRSDTLDQTFVRLLVEGLATRDFEPALRLLVGSDAPLSPSTIRRLVACLRDERGAFGIL